MAVLKRNGASEISRLMRLNKAGPQYFLKPKDSATVCNRIIGPQQLSVISFKCSECDVEAVLNTANGLARLVCQIQISKKAVLPC